MNNSGLIVLLGHLLGQCVQATNNRKDIFNKLGHNHGHNVQLNCLIDDLNCKVGHNKIGRRG